MTRSPTRKTRGPCQYSVSFSARGLSRSCSIRASWSAPAAPRLAGHSAQGGPVEPGAPANLCVFDPSASTVVDPAGLASRSRNTPYAGRTFTGAVRHTVLRGEAVVIDATAQR